MKRQNIEVVLGFLDAIRRRDREAAGDFLDPEIVWRGVVPDLVCRSPGEVLDIFLGRRDEQIEVDRLELIGAEQGAVFAKGLCRYTSESLRTYRGKRTADLPEGLPHEVVHRDDLVVLP